MPAQLLTYFDMIDEMVEFGRNNGKDPSQLAIRGVIQDAYEEITTAHRWGFLQKAGRIHLHAVQSTGTVVYDHTGGTYERQLTLTDATWPDWAIDGCVRFGNLVSDIESVKSETVVTLDAAINPGQDVASTTYRLYPRYYWLPEDFVSFTTPMASESWRLGEKITMSQMLARNRFHSSDGKIINYAIGEVPDVYGRLGLFVYPACVVEADTIDFMYRRRPRELVYSGHEEADAIGTIAVTAGSAAVTGTTTAFESGHVNSLLRISSNANRPTGRRGLNRYAEERSILAVGSAAGLTLDAAVVKNRSAVGYVITDPIDLGWTAQRYFRWLCRRNFAVDFALSNEHGGVSRLEKRLDKALFEAMEADQTHEYDAVESGGDPMAFLDGDVVFE